MLSHNELKKGTYFVMSGAPCEVLDSSAMYKGRGSSVMQAKVKNLKTGAITQKTFHTGENFEEADIEKVQVKFIYSPSSSSGQALRLRLPRGYSRGSGQAPSSSSGQAPSSSSGQAKYVFAEADNPSKRFELTGEQLGEKAKYLLPNTVLEGLRFEGEIINVSLPIKMQFRVDQAPPGVQGDRAQGGTKAVTLETGAIVQVPLFVETDDVIELNTENGEYVRRIQ